MHNHFLAINRKIDIEAADCDQSSEFINRSHAHTILQTCLYVQRIMTCTTLVSTQTHIYIASQVKFIVQQRA